MSTDLLRVIDSTSSVDLSGRSRPTPNASCFQLNGSLNALSSSPDGTQVVVAGREVLKVLHVSTSGVSEALNLRAGARLNLNMSSNDVKWNNQFAKNIIATAATNGAVVIWDLNKSSGQKQERVITEHQRAVNRLSFHAVEQATLLSASQDGTVRLWDLRSPGSAKFVFEGKSESVRDVQFNPVHHFEFAAAFENGTIQKWDLRNPSLYEKKLNAHNGLALTIDWHPSGRYLASGGRDRVIKFWDMQSDSRKPYHHIQTIASLARIQWRPAPKGGSSLSRNHIASCSLLSDCRIHVWNLDRPYLPFYSYDDHVNVTTGFLWHGHSKLFSVGKDKLFVVHHMPDAEHEGTGFMPGETMGSVALSWNVLGDLTWSVKHVQSVEDSPLLAAAQTEENALTVTTSTMPASSLSVLKNISGSLSRESLAKNLMQLDTMPTYMTWSGSNVPNNFAYLLANLHSDDLKAIRELAMNRSKSTDIHSMHGLLITRSRPATISYFGRKLPRRTAAVGQPSSQTNSLRKEMLLNVFNPAAVQRFGFARSEEFDSFGFIVYALHGSIPGHRDPNPIEITEYCEQYALLSNDMDRPELAKAWTILRLLFQNSSGYADNMLPKEWQPLDLLKQMLEHYSNQGNVQMCVLTYLLLPSSCDLIPSSIAKQWFQSYIELLQRFQLWTVAAEIMKLAPFSDIQRMNQESTTMHTSCNICFKPLTNTSGSSWSCDRCKRLVNPCSICRLPVKSSYTWCQGCSHGGHVEHLIDWFNENDECPTGCGHRCTITR